jgi:hypothetical protein
MLTIDVKSLGKQVAPVVKYLNSYVDESPRVRGTQIKFTSVKARTAKILLHKFLRQRGIETYRVVTVKPGLVRVLKPENKKKYVYQKQPNLGAPGTIPYYQIAADTSGIVPKPGERKWKP